MKLISYLLSFDAPSNPPRGEPCLQQYVSAFLVLAVFCEISWPLTHTAFTSTFNLKM